MGMRWHVRSTASATVPGVKGTERCARCLLVSQRFLSDRSRIERELGAGGMATDYLAHEQKHGRKVAIKVPGPGSPQRAGGSGGLLPRAVVHGNGCTTR